MSSSHKSAYPIFRVDTFEASIVQDTEVVPDVTKLLNTLLEICNQRWISEFLFTNEPVHILHLTSRSLRDTAFTCDLCITRAGFMRLQPDPTAQYTESHRFHARYLLVPSFTVNYTTVGVGVLESFETLDDSQLRKGLATLTLLRNMRFVQNARERWLVALVDSPNEDRILMHNSDSRWSPTSRPHTFTAMFSRSKLLASVQNGDAHVTVQKLLWALLGFMHTSQIRNCPYCGARSGISCMCYTLSLPPPANVSFDSQMFKNSMAYEADDYQGITNKVLFAKGRQVRHVKLGAYSSFRCVYDASSVARLSRWALTKYARVMKEDPRQSLLLSNFERDGSERSGNQLELQTGNDGNQGEVCFSKEVPAPLLDLLADVAMQNPLGLIVTHGNMNYGMELPYLSEGKNAAAHDDEIEDFPTGIVQGISTSKSDGDQNGNVEWWDRQWKDGAARAMEAFAKEVLSTSVETSTPSLHAMEKTPSADKEQTVELGYAPSPSSDAQRGVRDLVRQIRVEERRERNRESARRSNLRAKLKLEGMKKELQSSRDRVDELRSKWMELNDENLRLQKSVALRASQICEADPET